MKLMITGASGLLGQHLVAGLRNSDVDVTTVGRVSSERDWLNAVKSADRIYHLAGVTRPRGPAEFHSGNVGPTQKLVSAIVEAKVDTPVLFASSIRANEDSLYGQGKRQAENLLLDLSRTSGNAVAIYRLAGFFGKWSKPDYNSVVATFCHNVVTGSPVVANTPEAPLKLVHLDAVVHEFVRWLARPPVSGFFDVLPNHEASVGQVAEIIKGFPNLSEDLDSQDGLTRGLYQTFSAHVARLKAD